MTEPCREVPDKSPTNECDLVMKGGIASGVVYGSAVKRIAQDYRFRSVAGTSAGAIAAVVTAAAEYRRQTVRAAGEEGEFSGFLKIGEKVDELARGIEGLFQAKPRYQKLLRALIATTEASHGAGFAQKFRLFLSAFIGVREVLIFLAFFLLSALTFRGGDMIGGGALILAAVVGPLIFALGRFAYLLLTLKRDDFGMCTGLGANGSQGVTDWIHEAVQDVAGKPLSEPLTVGDLWGPEPATEDETRSPGVVLVTMTTDLTSSRPYRTPIGDERHYFTEREMAELFPEEVVAHLKKCGQRVGRIRPPAIPWWRQNLKKRWADDILWRMPPARDFPVVMSARLSLSFPVLFTTVPLWRKDSGYLKRPEASDEETLVVDPYGDGDTMILRRCLMSDGGLSSNFPVHFFDSFLPRRPTFGITLGEWSADHDGEAKSPNVGQCGATGCGCDPTVKEALRDRVEVYDIDGEQHRKHGSPDHDDNRTRMMGGTLGFVMRMVDTAKDWKDNLQARLPGNAERIIQIKLTSKEGGYNLAMDEATLRRMNAIGALAGEMLVEKFSENRFRRFDEHRYLRALSFAREFSERLSSMRAALDKPAGIAGLRDYRTLLTSYSNTDLPGGLKWREEMMKFIESSAALNEEAPDLGDPMTPRQFAALRVSAEAQINEWPPAASSAPSAAPPFTPASSEEPGIS